jgi:colicin import membrane protein
MLSKEQAAAREKKKEEEKALEAEKEYRKKEKQKKAEIEAMKKAREEERKKLEVIKVRKAEEQKKHEKYMTELQEVSRIKQSMEFQKRAKKDREFAVRKEIADEERAAVVAAEHEGTKLSVEADTLDREKKASIEQQFRSKRQEEEQKFRRVQAEAEGGEGIALRAIEIHEHEVQADAGRHHLPPEQLRKAKTDATTAAHRERENAHRDTQKKKLDAESAHRAALAAIDADQRRA